MGASESQMKSNRMWEKIHPMTRDRIKSTGMKRQRNEGANSTSRHQVAAWDHFLPKENVTGRDQPSKG